MTTLSLGEMTGRERLTVAGLGAAIGLTDPLPALLGRLAPLASGLRLARLIAAVPSDVDVKVSGLSRDYVGALMDGEGHVGINKIVRRFPRGRCAERYISRVQISSIDTEMVEPLLGVGGRLTDKRAGRHNPRARQCFFWAVYAQESASFLRWVLPSMRNLRKRRSAIAAIMLEALRRRPGELGHVVDPFRVVTQEALYRIVIESNSGRRPTVPVVGVDDGELQRLQRFISDLVGNDPPPPSDDLQAQVVDFVHLSLRVAAANDYDLPGALVRRCSLQGRVLS